MKTLIVYYSFEGNCKFAAEELEILTGADIERLEVSGEPPKSGLMKFLRGGKSALSHELPELKALEHKLDDYERLIIMFPIWAGTYPPAIGSFIDKYHPGWKELYLVASSKGGSPEKAFESIRKALPECRVIDCLHLVEPLRNQKESSSKLKEFSLKMTEA